MQSSGSASNGKIDIRGIIFDYGNVLCHSQQPADAQAMAQACGLPLARFTELYWKFRGAYDRGDLDGESYWQAVAGAENRRLNAGQISELIALDTASWARENLDMVRWAEQLHDAGFPLALLSNMPHELSRVLSAQGKWARFFTHRVFSCDARCNKPDPAIYQLCLQALNLSADRVLFLDDIAVNVEAASRLGIHSLVFDSLEQTAARVAQRFNVPLPEVRTQSSSS